MIDQKIKTIKTVRHLNHNNPVHWRILTLKRHLCPLLHLAYQFNITGEAEGIFYIEVKEGKLYVEPYEYYDRDAMFICSAQTLRKIADGEMDPILAVTLRKLRVEGNIDKALKLKSLIESHKK